MSCITCNLRPLALPAQYNQSIHCQSPPTRDQPLATPLTQCDTPSSGSPKYSTYRLPYAPQLVQMDAVPIRHKSTKSIIQLSALDHSGAPIPVEGAKS